MYYVYKIVNDLNDKVYVGRTKKSLSYRWNQGHMKRLACGDMRQIYCAMRKYGVQHFHIELLQECTSFKQMVEQERYWCEKLEAYSKGYNMTTAGEINPMECSKSRKSHDDKMRSKKVRSKISKTMHEYRLNEYRLTMHKDRQIRRIPFELVEQYLKDGWHQGFVNCSDPYYDGLHIRVYKDNCVEEILPNQLADYKDMGWKFSSPKASRRYKKDREESNTISTRRVRLHKDGRETTVYEDEVDLKLKEGWQLGGKPGRMSQNQKLALANSHKNISDTFKQQQSKRLRDFYAKNPDWKTKSKRKVHIVDPESGTIHYFDSCKDLCLKLNLPLHIATAGVVNRWIKLGYIKRKNSVYNGWRIYDTK